MTTCCLLWKSITKRLANMLLLLAGDLLLCRKIKECERQERLDNLSLGDIFTTGLSQGDAGRYYSS